MKRTAVSPQHLRLCKNECRLSRSSPTSPPCLRGWKHFFVIAFNSMLGVAAVPLLRLRLSWGKLSILCHRGFCAFKWHYSWCDTVKGCPALGLIPIIFCIPGTKVGIGALNDLTHQVATTVFLMTQTTQAVQSCNLKSLFNRKIYVKGATSDFNLLIKKRLFLMGMNLCFLHLLMHWLQINRSL